MKLPFTTKQIGMAVGALFLVILLIYIISKVKTKIEDALVHNDLVNEANAEINKNQLTMTNSQFNTLATKLYSAMKGPGTDEEAVFNAFGELGTRSDLEQLLKTYDVKDSKTLKEWLYDELSIDDVAHINEILAAKNINYVF